MQNGLLARCPNSKLKNDCQLYPTFVPRPTVQNWVTPKPRTILPDYEIAMHHHQLTYLPQHNSRQLQRSSFPLWFDHRPLGPKLLSFRYSIANPKFFFAGPTTHCDLVLHVTNPRNTPKNILKRHLVLLIHETCFIFSHDLQNTKQLQLQRAAPPTWSPRSSPQHKFEEVHCVNELSGLRLPQPPYVVSCKTFSQICHAASPNSVSR